MKKTLAIFDLKKSLALILGYHRWTKTAAAQMCVGAVLCGMELQRMKKQAGHGNWEEAFEDYFKGKEWEGFTLRTAQNYMRAADGVKTRALKNETVSFCQPVR